MLIFTYVEAAVLGGGINPTKKKNNKQLKLFHTCKTKYWMFGLLWVKWIVDWFILINVRSFCFYWFPIFSKRMKSLWKKILLEVKMIFFGLILTHSWQTKFTTASIPVISSCLFSSPIMLNVDLIASYYVGCSIKKYSNKEFKVFNVIKEVFTYKV